MNKYILPAIFCLPTLGFLIILMARIAGGPSEGMEDLVMPIVGLSFLADAASIAMIFVKPESKEWRLAALFTCAPFILLLIVYLIIRPGLA